jgi:hypothetical protein
MTLIRKLATALVVLSLALLGFGCANNQSAATANAATTAALSKLVSELKEARITTELYARNVRRRLAKEPDSPQMFEAERLYESARGSVNALLNDVQGMVRSGGAITGAEFETRRQTASAAVVDFNTLANNLLSPAGAAGDAKFIGALTLDGIAGLGTKLWDEIVKRRNASREAQERWTNAECDRLKAAEWATFAEIK